MRTNSTVTTSTSPTTTSPMTDAEPVLRRVLALNATTSGLGGLTAIILGGPIGGLLGVDRTGWIRLVGAGLVAFSAFVLVTARSSTRVLRAETPVISAGDAAWGVGTVVTITFGWYSATGAMVMAVVGAAVGALGVTQMVLVRRL